MDHDRTNTHHWNKTGTRNVRLPVSQNEIARRTGFSSAAISRILGRGRRTNDIRLKTAKMVADAAEVTLDYLYEYLNSKAPQQGVQDRGADKYDPILSSRRD